MLHSKSTLKGLTPSQTAPMYTVDPYPTLWLEFITTPDAIAGDAPSAIAPSVASVAAPSETAVRALFPDLEII
jgi:hypothetical protein